MYFRSMTQLSGANFKTIPLTTKKVPGKNFLSYEYDWDLFAEALGPQTKVVLLTNPHNPTGKCLRKSDIEKITDLLNEKVK